ncbi:MAG: SUMF1/EgtB/PvdO family nonheme iron enzyme [Alistipes sp.]|nr:SUMF1/EgtB/PvdO family nonheme iron enzyme [Alistipes sp.]
MKRLFICILSLFVPLFVLAQQSQKLLEIDESSFRPEQTDVLSGVAIDKIARDPSQRPCARIKMHINRMTTDEIRGVVVRTVGGNVVLTKQIVAAEGNGLIIEMTAKEQTRFYIHHDKYGDSNEVSLHLEGDKEYRINAQLNFLYSIVVASNTIDAEVYLDDAYKGRIDQNYMLSINGVTPGKHKIKLQQGALVSEQEVNVSSSDISFRININQATARPQYVIFEVEPKDAEVMVGDKSHAPDGDGIAMLVLNNGSYNYSVSAKDYYRESGTFVVSGAKVVKRVILRPAHGWLSVSGSGALNGAKVYVDGALLGSAPVKSDKLASGTHTVRIIKGLYKTFEGKVSISDGQTLSYAPALVADFANVSLNVGNDCDIYVNGERKGKNSWRGDLATGAYIFEARKAGHTTTSISKTISATPAQQKYDIPMPKPVLGYLNVLSTPNMADVYIDDKLVGQTPLMLDLIVGEHTVKVSKGNLSIEPQTITIAEGKTENLNLTLVEVKPKSQNYTETAKDLNMKMIYVEGSTFSMGSTAGGSDEKPVHSVTLDSYYIAETEVTQAQWRAIMGNNPSYYKGDNRPVENVSWFEAQKFCEKLSAMTGKKYVLPTEAQWEYAARGGNKSKGYTYNGSNDIGKVAKYNSSDGHNNVKSKQPNELGIYDMSGNVWEWCSDWYGSYSSSSLANPTGPSSGSNRVLRGGSWSNIAGNCRVPNRYSSGPSNRNGIIGFRFVCLP